MVSLSQFGDVPGDLLSNANLTISILNEIFSTYPNKFRFTSGFRSAERNAAVNGVNNSFHLKALAGDFVPINGSFPYSDAEAIGQIVLKYGWQVIKHNAGSGLHYHIEPAPGWNGSNVQAAASPNYLIYGVTFLFLVLILKD